jgi:hypothetical protein
LIVRSYADWRSKIPWTDAEIVVALREVADDEQSEYLKEKRLKTAEYFDRTGRLSKFILGLALPLLVKQCEECGKVALYRVGVRGYCREHRVSDQGIRPGREVYAAEWEQDHLERERQLKSGDRLHTLGRSTRGRGRQRERRS